MIKWRKILLCLSTCSVLMSISCGLYVTRMFNVSENTAVNLYTFDSPRELAMTQAWLKDNSTEEAYKELSFNNSLREVNTYQKFNYDSCKTVIKDSGYGYCVYGLESEHIDKNNSYLMLCSVDPITLKLSSCREYRLLDFCEEGVSK